MLWSDKEKEASANQDPKAIAGCNTHANVNRDSALCSSGAIATLSLSSLESEGETTSVWKESVSEFLRGTVDALEGEASHEPASADAGSGVRFFVPSRELAALVGIA